VIVPIDDVCDGEEELPDRVPEAEGDVDGEFVRVMGLVTVLENDDVVDATTAVEENVGSDETV
jgi:hypothetical protein